MAFNLVPSGTILPFGGPNAPSGWLLCNGLSVSQTAYPALYDVVGVLWGNPGGGSFNVPNLVGAFARGIGTSGVHVGPSGVGVVQTHATAKNNLTSSSSSVTGSTSASSVSGSIGSDGTHTHGDNGHIHDMYSIFNVPSGSGGTAMLHSGTAQIGSRTGYASINTSGSAHGHSHSLTAAGQTIASATAAAQTLSSTDTETRPNSKGVNYIIKI